VNTRDAAQLLLLAGKSVLLAGAPGTGKTREARELARRMTGVEPETIVGRGDLGYEDLLYRYEPSPSGYKLVLGPLAVSVISSWIRIFHGLTPVWLLFDEINRFNAEVVLGDLFLVLDLEHRKSKEVVPQSVMMEVLKNSSLLEEVKRKALGGLEEELEFGDASKTLRRVLECFPNGLPLPYSWRALATMNLIDRAHLFRLGFALLRRFPLILYPRFGDSFNPALNIESLEEGSQKFDSRVLEVVKKFLTSEESLKMALKELSLCYEKCPWDRVLSSVRLAERRVSKVSFTSVIEAISTVVAGLLKVGVDVGYALLLDVRKILVIASLLGRSMERYQDESFLADVVISSLLLPQIGGIAPAVKADIVLTGRSARLEKLKELVDYIVSLLGEKSMSAYYMEALRLELPL